MRLLTRVELFLAARKAYPEAQFHPAFHSVYRDAFGPYPKKRGATQTREVSSSGSFSEGNRD